MFMESWGRLNDYEKGEDDFDDDLYHPTKSNLINQHKTETNNKFVSSLLNLDLACENSSDKIIKSLYESFLKSLLRYVSTIDGLSLARLEEVFDKKTVEEADINRRRAHESWISSANALSRYFYKMGLDNSWRNVIGSTRIEQTKWAESVSNIARKIVLK
jgi:hypothetical protein